MSEDKKTTLIPASTKELTTTVDSYQRKLITYLGALGLPNENVLVDIRERIKVFAILPSVVEILPKESSIRSLYISKFVAACGAGLFDAALNFVWDETVADLRTKVIQFDLDYFYSSVVTDPDRRRKFNSEADIINLEDWELIRGCHLTGILSDIGFRHLDYIRNMRNWASAAHPNQIELTGLQLVSWLETCIREVMAKEPSASAIEIRRLLFNIRTQTLTSDDVSQVIYSVARLPDDLATSLLRTIFGIFCDPAMIVSAKNNIRLIALSVWRRAPEQSKRELGIKYTTYAANADIPRRDAARDFLQTVDGMALLPTDTLAVEINDVVQALYMVHSGFDNFYNEPPHAKSLTKLIPPNGSVPDAVRYEYVKTVTMCFIGNGYGISNNAYPYYEELVRKYQEQEIYTLLTLLRDEEFSSRLQFQNCQLRFKALISGLKGKTANSVISQAIDYLLKQTDEQLPVCGKTTEYKRIIGK